MPGQHYTTNKIDIPGYQLDHASANANGLVGQYQKKGDENPIVVTYYYKVIPGQEKIAQYSIDGHRDTDQSDNQFVPPTQGGNLKDPFDYQGWGTNSAYQKFLEDNNYVPLGGENIVDGYFTPYINQINFEYRRKQPVMVNYLKAVIKNGKVVDTTTKVAEPTKIIVSADKTWRTWQAVADDRTGYSFSHVELGEMAADDTLASGTNDRREKGSFTLLPQQVNFYYLETAEPQTEEKTVTRVVHYVENNKNGQALKDPVTQKVTLTGTYYVRDGKRVNVTPQTKNGKTIYVVNESATTPTETWAIKGGTDHDASVNNDNNQQFDFNQVTGDVEAPDSLDPDGQVAHTWYQSSTQNNKLQTIDPNKLTFDKNGNATLDPVYLIYQQKGQYDIHYIDLTTDTELTNLEIAHIGDGQYAGTKTDASADIANRAKSLKGKYVIVKQSANLGKQVVNPDMQDQYVYLRHAVKQVTSTTPQTDVPTDGHGHAAVDPAQLTKTATRTIHYVTQDEHKQLLDDTTQNITFNGSVYVDVVTGQLAKPETVTDVHGNKVQVATTTPDTITWTAKDGKNSFDPVTKNQITNGKQAGTWTVTSTTANNAPKLTVPTPSSKEWKDTYDATLEYRQNVEKTYNIHYIDETAGNKELTDHEVKNIGDGKFIGDTPDVTDQLWKNYTDKGYVRDKVSDNAEGGKLGKQELTKNVTDQYVYLKHGQTTSTNKTTKDDQKSTTTSVSRRIYYRDAKTGKKITITDGQGKQVAPTITQKVNYVRVPVYDSVNGSFLGFAELFTDPTTGLAQLGSDKKPQIKKNADGTPILMPKNSNGWVPTGSKEYPSADSPDLTKYGYKKAQSLDQQTDKGNGAKVDSHAADPTKDGSDVNVYYFHGQTTSTNKTKKADQKSTTTSVSRKIYYRDAKTGKKITITDDHGHKVAPTITQKVNYVRVPVYDSVDGSFLGFAELFTDSTTGLAQLGSDKKPQVKKDANGTPILMPKNSNGWVPIGSKEYPSADSPDLSKYGYKKAQSLDQQKDKGNGAKVDSHAADPTKDGSDVNVYYFHDTTNTDKPKTGVKHEALSKTFTRTVVYKGVKDGQTYDVNGSPFGTAKYQQKITFTRQATIDKVDNKVIGYTDWKPVNGDQLSSVDSKRPNEVGYDTVDINQVPAQTVNPKSGETDLGTVTVTYRMGHQVGTITYIDDVTGKTLGDVDKTSGEHGEPIQFNVDEHQRLNNYLSKGYELVSNNFTGNETFDKDNEKNNFVVHLTHGMTTDSLTKTFTRTITYVDRDTGAAVNGAPDGSSSYKQTATFTLTEVKDKVTGKTLGYNTDGSNKVVYKNADTAWQHVPSQTLTEVISQTPEEVNYDHYDTPKIAQETVKATSTPANEVVKYWNNKTTTTTKTVTETIHYVYKDGRKAHDDYVAVPKTFTHTVVTDGDKVISDTWTPAQTFEKVTSPEIPGYTPDYGQIGSKTVDHDGGNIDLTVTYTPTPKTYNTSVKYVDVDGNELIPSVDGQKGLKTGDSFNNSGAKKDTITTTDGTQYKLVKSENVNGTIADYNETTTYVYEKVAQPTQPTNPTTPTQPTEPTTPTSPTQPTKPTTPTSPTQPTKPTNPTTPTSPTQPTEPTNPTTPTSPTQPTEPTNPTTPTSPTQPTEPTNPTTPTSPTQPTEPTNPTTPTSPTQPTEPTNPTTPTSPTQPTEPTNPTTPTSPTQPTEPTTPTSPTQPTQPGNQPTTPAKPGQPVLTPAQPTTAPSQPTTAKLPQTGNESHRGLIALGFAGLISLLGLGKRDRRHD